MGFLAKGRRWLAPALAGLIALEGVLLWLSPAEQKLGQVVKLVYLHGALIRAGLAGFVVAAALSLAYLIARRAGLYLWLLAAQRATLLTWVVYVLSSMAVTYLTWGVAIAWGEPRVMTTIRISVAALLIFLVTELLKQPLLTAAGTFLLGAVALWATQSAGVIRHPIDPIGGSSSATIKLFYAGIVGVMLLLVATVTLLLRAAAAGRRSSP
jgi:hypothetical protein